jgi:hypothetical protein
MIIELLLSFIFLIKGIFLCSNIEIGIFRIKVKNPSSFRNSVFFVKRGIDEKEVFITEVIICVESF